MNVSQKTPVIRVVTTDEGDGNMVTWSFRYVDMGFPFATKEELSSDVVEKILPALKHYSKHNWHEVRAMTRQKGSRCHSLAADSLSSKAKERLKWLILDDSIDDLFSFTVDGRRRIIGIKSGAVCNILWYDPNHDVSPSAKKHT